MNFLATHTENAKENSTLKQLCTQTKKDNRNAVEKNKIKLRDKFTRDTYLQ